MERSGPDARAARTRAELVARLSNRNRSGRRSPAVAAAVPDASPFPLSAAQHGIWLSEQLRGAGAVFNVPGALRLRGPIDVPALRRSLASLVARQSILRTGVTVERGVPLQRVHDAVALPLPPCDLSALPDAKRLPTLKRILRGDGRRPFALDRPPLVRVRLFTMREREHVLAITTHHLICDGWSMRLLLGELAAHYNAAVRGEIPPSPLTRHYRDYVAWQQRQLDEGRLDADLRYWRAQLAGELPPLRLAVEGPLDASPQPAGSIHQFEVGPALLTALKAACRGTAATTFVAVLSAFQLLLHCWSRAADIVVGVDVANRRPEFKDVVGLFANQLAIRASVDRASSFRDLVARVHRAAIDALAHQTLPFERIVSALNHRRDPDRPPVFQVKFAFEEGSSMLPAFDGLRVGFVGVPKRLAKFDLTMFARVMGNDLYGTLEYDTAVLNAPTVARMADDFIAICEMVAAQPDAPLGTLALPGRSHADRAARGAFRGIKPQALRLSTH